MRTSTDQIKDGRLLNGYDYKNQAWVKDGKYIRCGHPESMNCGCYGRKNAGKETATTPRLHAPSKAQWNETGHIF